MDQTFYKKLAGLMFPIVFQNLMLASVAVADAIMLGSVEQNSMAAVSLATQIQFIQNMFLGAIVASVAILGAQYWGKGDQDTLNDIFCMALRLCGAVSVVAFVGCVFFPQYLMRIFTNETVLIDIGISYLQLAGWSYLLTGITQCYLTIMKISEHAKQIREMDLDGYAVGGLAVGETHEEMYRILDAVVPYLPQDKPTYLMGVGTPANILEGVERGIDFFDCVYPSRNGRHGHVYTNHGKMNMFNAKYELDTRPIEEGCGCPACRHYSRAYIRHLLKAKEMLGMRLCVLHNLYFYNHMMEEIRDALDEGRFADYKKMRLEGFAAGEQK